MKKFKLIIGIAVMISYYSGIVTLTSCGPTKAEYEAEKLKAQLGINFDSMQVKEIMHDGCQYLMFPQILYRSSGSSWKEPYVVYQSTHKGNCTNPIHKCN